jgi:hypothetical protein
MSRPTKMLLTLHVVAIALIALVSAFAAETSNGAKEARELRVEPTRTGKERLGGKASDEQRVDNCKVPLDLRGPAPRPDDCAEKPGTKLER